MPDREASYEINRRVDLHELKISNIDNSLIKIEHVLERDGESLAQMSEAIVRLASQQEMLQELLQGQKENNKRISSLEREMAVSNEKSKKILKLEDDVETLKTGQTKNTTKMAAVVSVATLFVSSSVAYLTNKILDIF